MSTTFFREYLMLSGSPGFPGYLKLDSIVAAIVFVAVLAVSLGTGSPAMRVWESGLAESSLVIETPDLASVAAPTATPLAPAMSAALNQVVQRYRVSPEALLPVFEAIQAAGREYGLDPTLIIAVICIESRFNPYSQSPMGAQGLMQVIPRFHQDKLQKGGTVKTLFDPVTNVRVGTQILQEAIRRQGGLKEGLQFYGGVTDDSEQAYANKVLAEKLRLEQPPRRKDAN